jgi:hypothetical protein
MRTSSLLLFVVVVSQVNDSHGFALSSHQPTATAASRMNTAVRVVNSDDANTESEASSLSSSSRQSRRDIFRGSLLAGAAAAMIPFENANAMDFFSEKSRIGGLADKIRGILKNMVSLTCCVVLCCVVGAMPCQCQAKGSV